MNPRPKRVVFASIVFGLAGAGIAAFGLTFLVRATSDPSAGRVGLIFFWAWAVFFAVIGLVHIVAAAGSVRGRRWGMWLGIVLGFGLGALGAYTLLTAMTNVTRYMDVPGTIGLGAVSGLYVLAGCSLLSARRWFARLDSEATAHT